MSLGALMDETFETTAGARTLRDMLAGDRPTVMITYPMDFTSVCTKQLCSYRDDWPRLSKLPCNWWGVNRARIEKHRRFKDEKRLPFDLVTDSSGTLLQALGLKGLVAAQRGFAVVTPEGEVLNTMSVFPLFFPKTEEVEAFVGKYASAGSVQGNEPTLI